MTSPSPYRALGVEAVAREQVTPGEERAERLGPHEAAAVAGRQSDRHVRVREGRAPGGDDGVAAQHDRRAEADRGSLDCGDDRNGQVDQLAHEPATDVDVAEQELEVVVSLKHEVEVPARGEHLARRREHDGPYPRCATQPVQHLEQLVVRVRVEAVVELGPDEGDLGDGAVRRHRHRRALEALEPAH